jgi:hypothetical protein
MELAFADDHYLRIQVVGPGTAGIPYDCRVAASMKCGAFSGTVEAWLEGSQVMAFIESLNTLGATLGGSASLLSDDGALSIVLAPSDSLGHFALEVQMAEDTAYGSKTYRSLAAGVFLFEGQALSGVCRALIDGVGG